MVESSLNEKVNSLFYPEEIGIFTSAAGYSHAKYEQYTDLSQLIHSQMLKILNSFDMEYFLFAGSMVGYVRNERMPDWMDDLDIIIFEEDVEKFEKTVVSALKECGFNCFSPKRFVGGGYHILSMQQGLTTRDLAIPLTDEKDVSVPWAQIDVFYATVDEEGYLRNPAAWGIYHYKDVPADWVRPGQFIQLDDTKVRVFSDYESDIRQEYGDVRNNIVIHSHNKTYLKANDVAWPVFEAAFRAHIAATSSHLPPTLDAKALTGWKPGSGVYRTAQGESFASICAGTLSAGAVHLVDGEQIFWVMDLKRLFPGIAIHAVAHTSLQAQRAAHLRAFIDKVDFADDAVAEEHGKCIAALSRFLDA